MNKYERFVKANRRKITDEFIPNNIEYERVAGRLLKPGYRRKMRRKISKYNKKDSF